MITAADPGVAEPGACGWLLLRADGVGAGDRLTVSVHLSGTLCVPPVGWPATTPTAGVTTWATARGLHL
ncbi:hypothetical protein [Actinomycetospora cinnamomea]|uniref:hypothetical protein n=1 Tax=Actinomycetospora cinnamomea TaxID=663609 RepID=UPI00105781C3|nr:hypothetical protein [Actinomycetospora cinnamomea]